MPSAQLKSAQASLAAVAGVVLVASVLAWRSLSSVGAPPPAALQTVELDNLTGFLAPVPDSVFSPEVGMAPLVVHDPFGSPRPVVVAAAAESDVAPVEQTAVESHWIVNAVLITDSYRAAVINDSLITLGNKLSDGTRLTAVERDHVVLTDRNGTKRTITVRDGNN